MKDFFFATALAEAEEASASAWELLGEGIKFWVTIAVLAAVGVCGYLVTCRGGKKPFKKPFWTAKTMAVGAMCMALSSVLSLIKLWPMPMGGSITPASMLPLLVFAYCYGVGPGMVLGAIYGVMQFLLGGAAWLALGAIPNLLDYPLAFAMLGLAGLFRGSRKGMCIGFTLGCFGRFCCSFLSGFVFYGQYAPEGMNPAWYSFLYNGTYMLPECLICIGIGLLIGERLVKELRKQ